MHQIVPFHRWRNTYLSEEDDKSPFYGMNYNLELYSKKIYNYFIHSEWDDFGSNTLYLKVLYVDYQNHNMIIELMGEWNDCLYNDIMYLKREVIDLFQKQGIRNYIIICDNVLNFHSSDDSYYEEWWDDVKEDDGKIVFLNTHKHVWEEMQTVHIQFYAHFGDNLNDYNWRGKQPNMVIKEVNEMLRNSTKQLN